jgi:hypothetical protein
VLSKRHVEIGLVPLGAIGMSLFSFDLYFASRSLPPAEALSVAQFLAQPAHWRVMADLLGLSLCAGLDSVPMYALIQLRSQPTHRARIIAANNILNALFMIASAVMAGVALQLGASIPQLFLALGLLNAVVAAYIFLLVPEYLLRFVAFVLSRLVYRFRVRGEEHIPTQGAALIVANHVSFIDAVLLMAASPRPIRFVMDAGIFRMAHQVVLALLPGGCLHRLDRAGAQRELVVGDHQAVVDPDHSAEPAAGLASAHGGIEREHRRRGLAVADVALGAMQAGGEPPDHRI